MATAIDQALQAAQAASQAAINAQQVPVQSAEVIQHPAASTAVIPAGKIQKLSMNDMQGGLNVDAWVKVKEHGLILGDSKPLDGFTVSIDMTDGAGFIPKMAIKAGNPAQYFYTLDRVYAASGGSWEAACQRARNLDPNAREYRCVDLPMRLEEAVEVTDPKSKSKTVLANAGQVLGYTTSTTNWANWAKFYSEVEQAGLMGKRVKVFIGAEKRSNKNGNTWGVMTFELLGELEEDGE